jgi:hypothetical protein
MGDESPILRAERAGEALPQHMDAHGVVDLHIEVARDDLQWWLPLQPAHISVTDKNSPQLTSLWWW